jgi:hypothetical protein
MIKSIIELFYLEEALQTKKDLILLTFSTGTQKSGHKLIQSKINLLHGKGLIIQQNCIIHT